MLVVMWSEELLLNVPFFPVASHFNIFCMFSVNIKSLMAHHLGLNWRCQEYISSQYGASHLLVSFTYNCQDLQDKQALFLLMMLMLLKLMLLLLKMLLVGYGAPVEVFISTQQCQHPVHQSLRDHEAGILVCCSFFPISPVLEVPWGAHWSLC